MKKWQQTLCWRRTVHCTACTVEKGCKLGPHKCSPTNGCGHSKPLQNATCEMCALSAQRCGGDPIGTDPGNCPSSLQQGQTSAIAYGRAYCCTRTFVDHACPVLTGSGSWDSPLQSTNARQPKAIARVPSLHRKERGALEKCLGLAGTDAQSTPRL